MIDKLKVKQADPYRKKYNCNYLYLIPSILLLILPAICNVIVHFDTIPLYEFFTSILISLLIFLIPLCFFYWNVKVYQWLLLSFIILSPLIIFSIFIFDVKPGWLFVSLILQTNMTEAKELAAGYLKIFLPIELAYILLYIVSVRKLKLKRLAFRTAALVSFSSFAIALLFLLATHQLTFKGEYSVKRYYPMSLIAGILTVVNYKVPVDTQGFHFNAYKKVPVQNRMIHILVIGESSRYDHWQINGYNRPTSPLLDQQTNLITFPNMMAGAHVTWMAVPLMITRSSPADMEVQFHEKSVLSAFKDANYTTAWLSNQSDRELYFSGTTPIHAKTADYSIFSPNSNGLEITDVYDERLLPKVDSILHNSDKDAFIVLHTMGSHFDYSKRYPPGFDVFKPSGKQVSIKEPSAQNKDAVINSYDNSVLYTDFIIDSVIKMVKKYETISSVTFISDHGENLYDLPGRGYDAHTQPSKLSLHVPFFVWTSDTYNKVFPQKVKALMANRNKQLSSPQVFYTLLDIADITFPSFDSTRSIASNLFTERTQQYYDLEKNQAVNINSLKQ